jgi:alanine-glyoxylate transaminase / serine-glyoxylate transaminase / serine-pyruvate transaminase
MAVRPATPTYHRTHSCYAVAGFHEALRIILDYGRHRKASDYAYHEKALRGAAEAMGCDVTSNTTSLIVLNLPGKLAGKEKELVAGCRAHGFGIWPTLSEPIQVRIGILNQLSPEQITEIVSRFADAMLAMGSEFDKQQVMNGLKSYYAKAA